MYTVTLDGVEYTLRCDLNVIEAIEEKYDSVTAIADKRGDYAAGKFLIAEMINEHFYYTRSPERVTEDFVGARLDPTSFIETLAVALSCLHSCIVKKN